MTLSFVQWLTNLRTASRPLPIATELSQIADSLAMLRTVNNAMFREQSAYIFASRGYPYYG